MLKPRILPVAQNSFDLRDHSFVEVLTLIADYQPCLVLRTQVQKGVNWSRREEWGSLSNKLSSSSLSWSVQDCPQKQKRTTLLQPQNLFLYRDIWKASCGLTQCKTKVWTCLVYLWGLNWELVFFPLLLYCLLQLWHGWGICVTISKISQSYWIQEWVCSCLFTSWIHHP